MSEKTLIIIGAGIAGLSAACYARMNGYNARILEMHDSAGGLCTSWNRKGYIIDGCLQWLVGAGPNVGIYRMWEELGAGQDVCMVHHEEYLRVEGEDGKALIIYTDADRLAQHMRELAPEDSAQVGIFIEAIRQSTQILQIMRVISDWKKITVRDFAAQFRNPFLREAFSRITDLPDFPMASLIMMLGWMHQQAAGYPEGGSREFAHRIERRCLTLGGHVNFGFRVTEIIVEEGQAAGVRLADGSEHRGDIVISAVDGYTTLFHMLKGAYASKDLQSCYSRLPIFPCQVLVAVGVNRSFEWLPHSVVYPLKKPVKIAGEIRTHFPVEIYNFDPSLAPPGKTVLRVRLFSDFNFWEELGWNSASYKTEKQKISKQVLELLEAQYPGLADQVEMIDVSTPLTTLRYTGNRNGSIEGWLPSGQTLPPFRIDKTLPGLENFYMAGHWVEPGGGVPAAAMSGRNAIQLICKRDQKPFRTSLP